MARKPFTRRSFLRGAAGGATTLAAGLPGPVLGAERKIALGIIGTGGRGQRLLRAIAGGEGRPGLEHIGALRVAAVCDLIPERAAKAAAICARYRPKVRQYVDFRKMLDREKLDACIVATEEANHALCVIPVLEADLHCFSEKPVEITVEKVDRVVRAARKADGIYQVGYQRRYIRTFRSFMDHIHQGHMGKVTFLQGHWQWTGGVGGRYLDMDASGCWFLAQACHHADVMSWVMGDEPPLRCAAMGAITVKHERPPVHCAEDHSAVTFQFPGNVIFAYTHLMYCCEPFTGERLWVHAEKGGVDLIEGMKYPRPGMGDPVRLGPKMTNWDEGTFEELDGFARHILFGEQPLSNAETARISALMGILAGRAMYRRGTRSFEPTIVTWDELGSTA